MLWYCTHKMLAGGLLLLAHAFFLAFTVREPLQAVHRGAVNIHPIRIANQSLSVNMFLALVSIEAIVGFVMAMIGFVPMMQLSPARASDQARNARYDQRMNTGKGFIHFNHRGTLAGRSSDAANSGASEADKNMA